jgi:hypothetical protein
MSDLTISTLSPTPGVLRLSSLAVLLSLTVACGEQVDWLVVETEVSALCVVELPTGFEANPTDGVASHVLNEDDLGIALSDKFTTEMYLRGVGISSFDGIENFDFIESLRVQVATGESEPVELLNYISDEDKGSEWFVASESLVDIATYIEAEDLELTIEFTGELPDTAWTANLEVCVSAQAAYRESF